MGGFRYKEQDWNLYDTTQTFNHNIEIGAVATPEKLEHIEEGLVMANLPISVTIHYSLDEMTNEEIVDGVRYLDVYTPNIEPKSKNISYMIKPALEDATEIEKDADNQIITISTKNVEPRWPDKLEIVLQPSVKETTTITDTDTTRRIMINSPFLATLASKPAERETVIDIKHWLKNGDIYQARVEVEAVIQPSNIIRFTKGLEITDDQITEMNRCNVKVTENLDGTFTATATSLPTVDIPLHCTII